MPTRFHVGWWLVLVGLFMALSASPAWANEPSLAEPKEPTARQHFVQGNRLYRYRKFTEAVAEYQAGALIEVVPVFDYNLGQCYRQLGQHKEAIWHYERFLKNGNPGPELRALVTGFVQQMQAELERQARTQPPAGAAPATSPPRDEQHDPPRPAAPPTRRSSGEMSTARRIAIGAGVAGLVGAGLGVTFGLRARSFEDDADAICPMVTCDRADEAMALIDRGKTNALYANVAFGVSGVAVIGAAALWITGAPRERKLVTIAPQVSSSFTGIRAALPF